MRSLATVSEAGPAPMQTTRRPALVVGVTGGPAVVAPRGWEPPRLSRQIATGEPSIRVLRQAGSQGRSQVRPRIPGNTLDSRLDMYASVYRASAISRMCSGTFVWAGQAPWQSTTRWK